MHTEYQAELSVEAQRLGASSELQSAISAQRKQEAKATMSKARAQAKQAMAKKKLKRNDSVR